MKDKVDWSSYALTCTADETRTLKSILKLYHGGQPLELDVTFNRGLMWKGQDSPRWHFDWGEFPEVHARADFRHLPLASGSVESMVMDPPFVAKNTTTRVANGKIEGAYTGGGSPRELVELYAYGLAEAARVLQPGGLLVVKCMDTLSGGKQYWIHFGLYVGAQMFGLSMEDFFIVYRHRIIWSPNMKRQVHARKNHVYYMVFRKGQEGGHDGNEES